MLIMECYICNRRNVKIYGEKNGCKLYKCTTCGYVFMQPQPSQEELNEFYSKDFFNDNYHPDNLETNEKIAQRHKQYLLDIDYLTKFIDRGRVLDFGCGNGGLLNLFPDSFMKYGYEINEGAKDFLSANKRIKLIQSFEALDKWENNYFDLVIMRGAI